jgi:FtsZ-interacting cell division protein YlmF
MQKRNTNCRNTEITMIVTSELDESIARRILSFAAGWSRVKSGERAA